MSTKQDIICQVKSIFHKHNLRPRVIQRGVHNIKKPSGINNWVDEVDNAYPKAHELKHYCGTVFLQFSTGGLPIVQSQLEYLIAYPHENIDKILQAYITPPNSRAKKKGYTHGVDYRAIRERKIRPFFSEDLDTLNRFIDTYFPRTKSPD